MKDLYSVHTTKEDLDNYYSEVREAYLKTFKRLGLDAIVTEAGGGVFTDSITHEFQVLSETGEDEIIYCPGGDFSANIEVAQVAAGKQCDLGHGPLQQAKAIEVGNIFRFGTSYSEKMDVSFADNSGAKQFAYLGSYGIGITRLIGVLVELFHDDRGIIWPENVAPYDAHLVSLGNEDQAKKVYEALRSSGSEVLWDDRTEVSAGQKFADADLIGIPVRLVVSNKTGEGKVEWKGRNEDSSTALKIEEAIKKLK
jgi:prolyl-tRNA synthetase